MTYEEAKLEAFRVLIPTTGHWYRSNVGYGTTLRRYKVCGMDHTFVVLTDVPRNKANAQGLELSDWWYQLNQGFIVKE